MNTHESYVSLETAKLLKEAGFDWKQYSFYNSKGILINGTFAANWNDKIWDIDGSKVSAPTLDVAQRWLREVKEWEAQVAYGFDEDGHKTYVTECGNPKGDLENYIVYFSTYEEAQEAGIKKALEIVLDKGK